MTRTPEHPLTPRLFTIERNDPRLCIKGTEHLYTVIVLRWDTGNVIKEVLAENCTEQHARLFAHALGRVMP